MNIIIKLENIKSELNRIKYKISNLVDELSLEINNEIFQVEDLSKINLILEDVHQKLYVAENLLINSNDEIDNLVIYCKTNGSKHE